MLEGHCLCGRVRYRYDGELDAIILCHCSQCRRAQGSAFASNSPIRRADFRLLAGEEVLKEFESSPGKQRAFCGNCGSPIYSRRDSLPDTLRLRIGTLSTPIETRPTHHIYADSRAQWYEILDSLPRHAELEK
ncbi:GFA family protein [Marinobacteraceae bacterium S3BR75-40.1]